ncbi:MAG: PQQ-binding-like beta-propeller repeat protein, partial [Pirellulales bacterium]|nr:PQQ-binding-like beta-propeller repeat protein [Pirellulales bacterium]
VAAVGERIFFGSSANGKVYCLDANTGRIIWTAITGGPVRLAPMVVDSLVYVGSDDGHVYCLRASDGSLVWKIRGAPEERQLLGSGKMISLYPVRTGVLVDSGVAYFAAGIFPSEGVFLYAVDAKTGKVIWRKGNFGESASLRPAISPQGYLLASRSSLYAPMGRVSPAAFDRRDGQLKYATFFGKTVGGTYALLTGEQIYTGTEEIQAYNSESHDRFATFPGRKILVAGDVSYLATDNRLLALDRKSKSLEKPLWKIRSDCHDELIMTGKFLYAGGPGRVLAIEAASGKVAWQAKVKGHAKGLAVANRRLIVSTDTGAIYAFAQKADVPTVKSNTSPALVSEKSTVKELDDADQADQKMRKAVQSILDKSGVRRGYCLVLGTETGRLALELARHSDLTIYAVAPDAEKAAAARKTIDGAGLYGSRVRVEHWPLDAVPYSNYFANLVVSETALLGGELPPAAEAIRMLKPCGGVLMISQPESNDSNRLRDWLEASEMKTGGIVSGDGTWAKYTRGPLPGGGSWTHQYADAGNSTCGDDMRVKPPFGVLWFGRPGPKRMVNRHKRAVGPLSRDGRLFVQGEGTIMAYDAYNGQKLWQRELPQVSVPKPRDMHRGSNLALGEKGLFVVSGKRCLRLDPATGETIMTYEMPPEPNGNKNARWGYTALAGDTLFGSHTMNALDSSSVFAVDVESGKPRWLYPGKQIPHNAIAIGDGRVFFISSTADKAERERVIGEQRKRIEELPQHLREKALVILAQADIRMAVAIDVASGKRLWQRAVDVARLPGKSRSGSMNQAAIYSRGVLILFGVYLDGHYWKEFFAGEFDLRRIAALSGKDGKTLWDKRIGFRVRPIIVGDTLHAEPWAFDLH